MKNNEEQQCCPKFEPAPWDDRIFEWDNKLFVKEKVFTLFYMPVNFGKVMRRLDCKIRKSGASVEDWLCLSDHTSKWNMDVYISVDKNITDAQNVTLSGKFYSKVYEGPFKDTAKWCKDYSGILKTRGYAMKKMYMWYTTCPKCAKKYGKNYVAIISEIENIK